MDENVSYCSPDAASLLIACCLRKNIPFYACRYPDELHCRFGAQYASHPSRSIGDGFRVVPFSISDNTPAFTISPDFYPSDIETLLHLPPLPCKAYRFIGRDATYEEYLSQASSLISRMKEGEFAKAVLSRTITRRCDTHAVLPEYFSRLCGLYPSAYVFMISNPGVCGWIGATPEILLESMPGGWTTMALAGTRLAGTEGSWHLKEQEEQLFVVRYIADILQAQGFTEVAVQTYTRQAAQVEHLCTRFDITATRSDAGRDTLVQALHPTPAVAGTPVKTALPAILATESHARRYYGGYLGESVAGGYCRFYVNLRSMEFSDTDVRLYVGGGLTALSLPQDEWKETCDKSQTLLSAFEK